MKTNLKTKSKSKSRDAGDICLNRSEYGLAISGRLKEAASIAGDELTVRLAERMEACASPENMFLGDGMEYEGKTFKGHGSLYGCGVKICTSCSSRQRRKNRKRVLRLMKDVTLRNGEKWRFITLTAPDLKGVPLFSAMDVLGQAWSYFRKRSVWVDNLNCGIKSMEFTLGNKTQREMQDRKWSLSEDGYHPHYHILLASRWIRFEDLQREWTECVRKAFKENGIDESVISTKSKMCFVNIQLVVDSDVRNSPNKIGKGTAVFEVTKYITKTDSWLKMPADELLAFGQSCSGATKNRWPRMFEVLGKFHGASGSVRSRESDDGLIIDETSEEIVQSPLEPFFNKEGVSAGENPFSLFGDLTAVEVLTDGAIGAALAAARSLNIPQLAKKAPRWIWKYEFNRRLEVIRRRRMESLASKYPNAKFVTLEGKEWHWERFYMVVVN